MENESDKQMPFDPIKDLEQIAKELSDLKVEVEHLIKKLNKKS